MLREGGCGKLAERLVHGVPGARTPVVLCLSESHSTTLTDGRLCWANPSLMPGADNPKRATASHHLHHAPIRDAAPPTALLPATLLVPAAAKGQAARAATAA